MNLLFLLLTLYNCVLQSPDFEIILLLSFFFNSYENQKRNMVHTYKKDASTHFEVLCVRYGTWSCCFWFWSLKHKMLRCHSFMRVPTKISNLSVFTEHEKLDTLYFLENFPTNTFIEPVRLWPIPSPTTKRKNCIVTQEYCVDLIDNLLRLVRFLFSFEIHLAYPRKSDYNFAKEKFNMTSTMSNVRDTLQSMIMYVFSQPFLCNWFQTSKYA